MPSSLNDLTSASAVALAGYPLWMAYTGLYTTYQLQCNVVLGAIVSSGLYHACITRDGAWCAFHQSRDVAEFADFLYAFTALVAVTPLVYEWWLKPGFAKHCDALHAAYVTVGMLLALLAVTVYQAGLVTTVTLGLYYGAPFAYALYLEMARHRHGWGWYARLVAGVSMVVAAVAVFEVETNRDFNGDVQVQSDTYEIMHTAWHGLSGVGLSLLATLIGAGGKHERRDSPQSIAEAKQQLKPLIVASA